MDKKEIRAQNNIMNKLIKIGIILDVIILIIIGVIFFSSSNNPQVEQNQKQLEADKDIVENRTEFAQNNPIFRFSAQLPTGFEVEYIPAIEAVNIYDSKASGSIREQSQIFIRYFAANDFLTLNTIDILSRNQTTVNGHAAVEYEIKKKPNVTDFPHQPSWRNQQHKLIDIRFSSSSSNPSAFYVFAYSPKLAQKTFEDFIDSIIFHNDKKSLVQPIDKSELRVTKKPFGIYVSPTNSPVSPEKFTGYHNAVDYEILPGEENEDVPTYAVCGGKINQKRTTTGYGGLLVQNCILENQVVTVIYGHVKLSNITKNPGDYLIPGEKIGLLGNGFSSETDNERKHLHLGIHKGSEIDIRGYVQNQAELNNWIDFRTLTE